MVWGAVAKGGLALLKLTRPARFFKAVKLGHGTKSIRPVAVVLAKFKATDIAINVSLGAAAVKFVDASLRNFDLPDSDEAAEAINQVINQAKGKQINDKNLEKIAVDTIRHVGVAGLLMGPTVTKKVLIKQGAPDWVVVGFDIAGTLI